MNRTRLFSASLMLCCSANLVSPSFAAEQSLQSINTAGHSSTPKLESVKSGWTLEQASGSRNQKSGNLRGAEVHYLRALQFASAEASCNKSLIATLRSLLTLYEAQKDYPNAYESAQSALEASEFLGCDEIDRSDLLRAMAKLKAKALNSKGKIRTILSELRSKQISPPGLIAQWQKLELSAEKAAAAGNYNLAPQLYIKAAFWAANNLKPAQNIQFETSLVAYAELQTLRKSNMAWHAIQDADVNTCISLPDNDALRRRLRLANALVLLRKKDFDAAGNQIALARAKLSNSDFDKIFAANCSTVQAQLYEFSDEPGKAKALVESALRVYEEKNAKSAMYAEALRCLARIERDEKHFDLSTELFEKSLSMAKLAFGTNNPALAPYYFDLGMTFLGQAPASLAKAKAAIHNAAKLGEQLFEKDSSDLRTYRMQEETLESGKALSVAIPGTTNGASELPP